MESRHCDVVGELVSDAACHWRLDAMQTVKGVGSLPPHSLGEGLSGSHLVALVGSKGSGF